MKEKRLKYFLPAERGSERCCGPSPLCGAAACLAASPFPGGLPRLEPWRFTLERGEIQPFSSSPALSPCFEAVLVAGALLPQTKELWRPLAGQHPRKAKASPKWT